MAEAQSASMQPPRGEVEKEVRAVANIPDLTFRMAPTTFATHFNGDVPYAQTILGHSDVNMTLGVCRMPQAARMQVAIDELAARFSGKIREIATPKERQA